MTVQSNQTVEHGAPRHCDEGFPELLEKIVRESGWDLRNYKKASLKRRIAVRLNTHNISSYRDYHSVLESDPAEYNKLTSTITIKVSEFFRDPEVFGLLKELIGRDATPGHLYKAWSCGCAHGEEAYSIGILLAEAAGIENLGDVRIFATDIDSGALDTARKGAYRGDSMRNLCDTLRNAYFHRSIKGYEVRDEIRHLVRFGALDIVKDMPISKVDVLLCRNMLIYFEKELQRRVLEKLDFALKLGGLLVLGAAEVLPLPFLSRYTEIKAGSRVYRKLR